MVLKINCIGNDRTTKFAANELMEYLKKMDNNAEILLVSEKIPCDDCINVGICENFDDLLPSVKDKKLDDAIYIDIKNSSGIITATNERSVLIAVYRFLRELGCRFIRPGKDNEIIPECRLDDVNIKISETASYRHRENCIEGAVSYEHVADMIDWMPKIGMNSYFMQFIKPYGFFRAWYDNKKYPHMVNVEKSDEELDAIIEKLEDEISKRSLFYSKVGHSWATECLGISTNYWTRTDEPPPEEIRKYLALVDGKRDWYERMPLCTNLCYSNPEVKDKLSDFVVEYAKKNPHVKNIVFWPSDSVGNACQCDECQKTTMVDCYVEIINMIDDKFAKENIDTKLSFLCEYTSLPSVKFNDSCRIIMMFAPIFKNLCESYPENIDESVCDEIVGLNHENCAQKLSSEKNSMAMLKKWQNVFSGDSVVYDYQLIWFYNMDPGNMICAENLSKNMKRLENIGLNGMSSCQSQRVFWPTALPMVTMAETLWNRNTDYEMFKKSYLTDAFGKDGVILGELLSKMGNRRLSHFMCSQDALKWDITAGEETKAELSKVYPVIEKLAKLIEKNVDDSSHPSAVHLSWKYLKLYPKYIKMYIDVWMSAYGEANVDKTRQRAIELMRYVRDHEKELNRVFDEVLLYRRIDFFFNTRKLPGVVLNM